MDFLKKFLSHVKIVAWPLCFRMNPWWLLAFLSWKLKLLALQNLGDIEIEEIAVQNRLNASSHNSDDIIEA